MDELLQSLLVREASRWGIRRAADYLATFGTAPVGVDSPELWQQALKDAASKLVYADEDMNVLDDKAAGFSLEKTPKALLDFACVLTSTRKDRDGDILESSGAELDPAMPLLWQHMPIQPIGKMVKTLKQSAANVQVQAAIADTALGRDATTLTEFRALRLSHGFKALEAEPIKGATHGWHVKRFNVYEMSLVSIPSNVDGVITAFSREKLHHPLVKAWAKSYADARPTTVSVPPAIDAIIEKSGRVLSAENEKKIKTAHGLLHEVVESNAHHAAGKLTVADREAIVGEVLTRYAAAEKADSTQECVSRKIRKLLAEGKPRAQAVAIALNMCGGKSFTDTEAESLVALLDETKGLAASPCPACPHCHSEKTHHARTDGSGNAVCNACGKVFTDPAYGKGMAGCGCKCASCMKCMGMPKGMAGGKCKCGCEQCKKCMGMPKGAAADGVKVYAPVEGSWDWIRAKLQPTLATYLMGKGKLGRTDYVWIDAMFPDAALVCVDAYPKQTYWKLAWTMTDGTPAWDGEPVAVEVVARLEEIKQHHQAIVQRALAAMTAGDIAAPLCQRLMGGDALTLGAANVLASLVGKAQADARSRSEHETLNALLR